MSIAPFFVFSTFENNQAVKSALRRYFPKISSAHLSEALAAAYGKKTHAALRADLSGAGSAPHIIALDEIAFASRLTTLSGRVFESPEKGGLFHNLPYHEGFRPIRTWSPGYDEIDFKTESQRVWRTMLVTAINAGVEQRVFSVVPGDNRWPDAKTTFYVYRFDAGGLSVVASVRDGGWDELSIHVVFGPRAVRNNFRAVKSPYIYGDVYAHGWLERRKAAFLQGPAGGLRYNQRKRLDTLAAIKVEPLCYADRGSFQL